MPVPDTKLDIDLFADVFSPKPTIAVTHGGDTIPREDFPFLAQAALDGRIDLARFVTSTISLDEVPERLPRIGEHGEIRTVALMRPLTMRFIAPNSAVSTRLRPKVIRLSTVANTATTSEKNTASRPAVFIGSLELEINELTLLVDAK